MSCLIFLHFNGFVGQKFFLKAIAPLCCFLFFSRSSSVTFESELIQELLQIAGVKKSRTTPYHPMGNGLTERFNRTLGGMIRALPPRDKSKWPQMLQTLTFAYNCTAHESTGYAPFYLMFGRIPRLPVDVMFHNAERDCDITDYDSYVKRVRDDLREALTLAQANADASQQRQARLHNLKAKGTDIEEGDQVLVANKGERGRRKLADKWSPTIYTVVSRDPRCHTYRIKNTSTGQEKVVHRNLLLLVNFLPFELDQEQGSVSSFDTIQESSDVSSVDQELSVVDSECDGVDRTADWVAETVSFRGSISSSRFPQVASEPAVESYSRSDSGDPPGIDSCDVDQATQKGSDDSPEGSNKHNVKSPNPSHSHLREQPRIGVEAVDMGRDKLASDAVSLIRTRAGRIVKPVNRLIQTMTQKHTQTRHAVGELARSLFL